MQTSSVENVVWHLEDLYRGHDDPEIEKDKLWCLEEARSIEATLRGRVSELGPAGLLEAIRRIEAAQERAQKLVAHAYLNFSTKTGESAASSLWQASQEFYSIFYRDTLFFELEWNQLEESKAAALSEDRLLSGYRHYLESQRRYKPHILSEAEERIIAEKEPVGAAAWSTLFDKVLGALKFGERARTESAVLSDLYHNDRAVRRQAALELTEGLGTMQPVLTHIFNTLLLDKAITDRLRSYPHWLRARNLGNEASDEVVNALLGAVSSSYGLVRRYYGVKRRMLAYDELFDYDRYAPVPGMPDRAYDWGEAKDIVLAAFRLFSPDMAHIAGEFFERGWIHAPVTPGKRSGAFAHPTVPSAHPYVLVNFSGKIRDVMTLAHELGHGVHQYLAREQGLINSETPLTTAETASVFGEMLVFRHLLEGIHDPAEKLALLCSKLEDVFATVFRQVSMNRFEDAVHSMRRTTGELAPEQISEKWMETQQAMFGDSVTLLEHYRTWWSYIPHFVHSPGYVYAYAFGELLTLSLFHRYGSAGPPFVPKYLDLLRAGGKAAPEELLSPFGIDLRDPRFWMEGLSVLEELVFEAESEAEKYYPSH